MTKAEIEKQNRTKIDSLLADISVSVENNCDDEPTVLIKFRDHTEFHFTPDLEISFTDTDRLRYLQTVIRGKVSIVTKIMFIGEILYLLNGHAGLHLFDTFQRQCVKFYCNKSKKSGYRAYNPDSKKSSTSWRLSIVNQKYSVTNINMLLNDLLINDTNAKIYNVPGKVT